MAEAAQEASDTQKSEIAELVEVFGKQCKVISNIGDFSNVVEVKLDDSDCAVKFQLEASYPVVPPHIIVKSNRLSVEQKEELSLKLGSEASSEGCSLGRLVNSAAAWVEEKCPDSLTEVKKSQEQKSPKHSKSKRQNGKGSKSKSEQDQANEKLPPMKTAMDVVSRVLWDESLPTDSFVIGYLDRHIGVVEKSFAAFSWEDVSSVDYNTLAIPKHRIQYFKYKGIKVWEKKSRLDNVFGSTGSGVTISDVIARHEQRAAASGEGSACSRLEGDSDSDDDDIVINIENQNHDSDEEVAEGELTEREKYWGKKRRPTHFLCLRITDPEVRGQVASTHAHITDVNAEYADCIIPPECLHMTLACLGLDTQEEVANAAEFLRGMKSELEPWNPRDVRLTLRDVDHFHHSCIYAQVHCDDHRFMGLVQHLRDSVREAGIEIRDVFGFVPHMTLMKMKKKHGYEFRSKYLDTARLFNGLKNKRFGVQPFSNIYLCEMSEARQPDGFYVSPGEIEFPFSAEDYGC